MSSRVNQSEWCARRQSAFIGVLFFAFLCSLLLFGAKEAQAQTEPLDSSAPPVGEVAEPDAKPVEEAVAPVSDPASHTLEEASAPVAATPALEEPTALATDPAATTGPTPEVASSPISGPVSEVSEPAPALEVADTGVKPVAQPVNEVVAPAIEEKSPLADTALGPPALDPIVGSAAGETVVPVAEGLPKVDSAPVQPVVDTLPKVDPATPVSDPVVGALPEVDTTPVQPGVDALPAVDTLPVVQPVAHTLPEVDTAPVAQPVADALPMVEATPVVQPVVDTLPKVDPAAPVSDLVVDALPKAEASPELAVAGPLPQQVDTAPLQPVVDPALRTTSLAQPTTTPVIETNLASLSTILAGASRALESASPLVVAGGSTTIASQSILVGLSSSLSESVARVLNSYSSAQEEVSHSLLGRLLAGLNGTLSSFSSWAQSIPTNQTPQPFSPGGSPAGSSSTPGSGSSGGMSLLGVLALFSLLLLGGKFLWSIRELLKPNSALIPIIERPG